MTLPLNSRLSALYDTNGTQKDFSFGFRVFFDPDNGGYGLEVRRQTADGYEVIPKSDYLVLPVEDNSAGVVRFSVAPSAGQQIYIAGKTPTIQQLVLTNFGRYSAESIETQFDFITAIIQEWLSALGEETRQRIAADNILTQYVVQRINDFVQQVNQNFDDKSQEIEDYIATIMPSFTQTLRDEIEAFAVAGMRDAIDQTLADSKAEIDDAVARANAAADAAAITGKVYDTPEAGVDPVTGVADGEYYSVRSPSSDSYIDEYQNVGGVATLTGKSYPSSSALNNIKHNNLKDRDAAEAHPASAIKNSNGEDQQEINDSLIRIVSNKTDLLTINTPRNKQVVYVTENEKRYIYNSSLTSDDNGVTVIGKWEMEIQDAYYASWFCEAESGVDESVKLQTGYDYAVSKKRAFIIDIKVDVNPINATKTALWIRSNSVLGFVGDGEVRMLPNNADGYDVIRVQDVENYVIRLPVLRGDRLTHIGTSGEWGYGLTVYQSKNGYIHKPRIYDMWGDGLYIGRQWGLINSTTPTNVTILDPYIEGARRNGISFAAGDNVNIIRPYITKVGDYDGVVGAFPKAGIDIEPEQAPGTPPSTIKNSKITSPTTRDCYAGVYVYLFSSDLHHTLAFDGITTIDGATTTCIGLFHGGSNCTGLIEFDHVLVKPPLFVGMQHAWNGASGLKCVIDKLTLMNVAQFEIRHLTNGDFIEKDLGGLFINKFSTDVNVLQVLDGSTDGFKLGSVMRKDPNSKGNLLFYGASTAQYKPEFLLDGYQIHASWSSSTRVYPNTIWQDPSIDTAGTTAIYMLSAGDYRRLKVGLLNTTGIVGQGCNISGLNLIVGGVAKTRASCQTLGGWLDFQNVEGGRTVIYDSHGEWTFS